MSCGPAALKRKQEDRASCMCFTATLSRGVCVSVCVCLCVWSPHAVLTLSYLSPTHSRLDVRVDVSSQRGWGWCQDQTQIRWDNKVPQSSGERSVTLPMKRGICEKIALLKKGERKGWRGRRLTSVRVSVCLCFFRGSGSLKECSLSVAPLS